MNAATDTETKLAAKPAAAKSRPKAKAKAKSRSKAKAAAKAPQPIPEKPTDLPAGHFTLAEIEAMIRPKAPRRDRLLALIDNEREREMVGEYVASPPSGLTVLKEKFGPRLWDRFIQALQEIQTKLDTKGSK